MNKYQDGYFTESPLGFHGDQYLLDIVQRLVQRIQTFIETGTHVGSTLRYFATTYPWIQCFGCEPYAEAFNLASTAVTGLSNVNLYKETSLDMFRYLRKTYSKMFTKPVLCWLDAHGGPYTWDLCKEVTYVTNNFNSGFILIDDFKVPSKKFSYDKHGNQSCCFSTVKPHIRKAYKLYYPSYEDHTSQFHPLVGWGLIQFGEVKDTLEDTIDGLKLGAQDG